MPIYEYECRECGHSMDRLQKISDDPLTDCPECGQPKLRKLMSAPRFRLKGAGWYETDFKTGDKRNLADGGDAASGAKSASSDGGGDGDGGGADKKSKPAAASGESKAPDKGAGKSASASASTGSASNSSSKDS